METSDARVFNNWFFFNNNFHQHQRCQDTISGSSMFAENNMSGLFTAETVSVCHHVFTDIFISYC